MNAYVSVIRRYVQSHAFCSSLDSQKILHCVPNKKNKPQLLVITSENVNQLFGTVYSVQWTWSIDDFRSITPHLFQPAQPMWNFNTTMVYCNWNNSVHCTFHRPDIFLLSNYQCWPSSTEGSLHYPKPEKTGGFLLLLSFLDHRLLTEGMACSLDTDYPMLVSQFVIPS